MNKIQLDKSQIKIGFDPEFFILDTISKEVKSGLDYPFGPKGEGIEICPNCQVENDNVTIEMVLPPVALIGGAAEAWENYMTVKNLIEARLPEGMILSVTPSHSFSEEVLSNPLAILAGCEQDFNAWNEGEGNEKPELLNVRAAGGHCHIGVPEIYPSTALRLVQIYDLMVTIPFLFLEPDTERRKMYGKAGSFRMCEFKVEARSSDNTMWRHPKYIQFVFKQLDKIVDFYNAGNFDELEAQAENIQKCINTSDLELAKDLMELFGIDTPLMATDVEVKEIANIAE